MLRLGADLLWAIFDKKVREPVENMLSTIVCDKSEIYFGLALHSIIGYFNGMPNKQGLNEFV